MNVGVGVATGWTAKCRRDKDGRLVLAVHTKDAELLIEGVVDPCITLVVIDGATRKC